MDVGGLLGDLNFDRTAFLLNAGGFLLLYLLLCLAVGLLARRKGRPFAAGFLLALFLSPLAGALTVWLSGPAVRARTGGQGRE
jgi:biotin transporter BioY